MLTNYEKVMRRFLPTFRQSAANLMVREYGIKQQKVAEMLGTTQAAVSKYINGSNKRHNIGIDKELVREFVEMTLRHKEMDAQRAMCRLCQSNIKFGCAFMVK
ncbi:MAG: helix-turn-helix domain-containing protein [Candidatus Micrarchaeota archaeon]|nr:helix-turn-helix domain-containing protein [Candidatus Micrarchaeota archaeon]